MNRSIDSADSKAGARSSVPVEGLQNKNPLDHSQPNSNSYRVPGQEASVFVGRKLFNASLRYLLSSSSSLGMFARSSAGLSQSSGGSTEQCGGGFPIALPYPEVFKRGWRAKAEEVARKKMLTALLIGLNFIHLNRPSIAPRRLTPGHPLDYRQWGIIRRLELFLEAWISSSEVGPSEMGRTAPKVESIEEVMVLLSDQAKSLVDSSGPSYFPGRFEETLTGTRRGDVGKVVGQIDHSPYSTFKEVESTRLKFIGRPSFNPVPFLDERSAFVYQFPLQASIPPSEFSGSIPFVQVHCSKAEKIKLFTLLDNSGRLALHLPEQVRPRYASGVFSVLKDSLKDRLILDSRPANCLEKVEQRWVRSLTVGESLCRLQLGADFQLRVSSNDLRDFYYLFAISDERSRRNILCGAVVPSDVKHLECYRSEFDNVQALYGALHTLAMGDTHAVGLAQTCHLSMSVQAGVSSIKNLLTLSGPTPRGPNYVGIVIDDFVSICSSPKLAPLPTKSSRLADHMQQVYEHVGLIPHKDKAFRDELKCTVWGTDIDGETGLIRGSLRRAIPLFGIVCRVAQIGHSTVELLQVISGSLVSLFLFRRRLLSILDLIFQACKERSSNDIIRLSGRLKGELLLAAFLLPVACTNIRAQISGRISASDASHWGEAAVTSYVPERAVAELMRHVIKKSVWTKLLAPGKAWARGHNLLDVQEELPEGVETYKSNPLWEMLAGGLSYHLLYKEAARGPRHINIGEVRAMLKAEKLLAARSPGHREIYGMDSQVGLGALCKGRSASASLNWELAKSIPVMVGYDTYPEFIYYETSINPADGPTRGRKVPAPSRVLPGWWNEFCFGEFSEFDRWRELFGLDDLALSGLPDFGEIDGVSASSSSASAQPAVVRVPVFADDGTGLGSDFCKTSEEHVGEAVETERERTCGALDHSGGATRRSDLCYAMKPGLSATTVSFPPGSTVEQGRAEEKRFQQMFVNERGRLSQDDAAFAFDFLQQLHPRQIIVASGVPWPPVRPGYLDLFSGKCGVAKAVSRDLQTWSITFDLAHGEAQDLNGPDLRETLERLLVIGLFFGWGAAPVCSSFSVAITPPVRTPERPEGIDAVSDKMAVKIAEGNSMNDWVLSLCILSLEEGLLFWVENPAGSWFFKQRAWLAWMKKVGNVVGFWTVDYCRYGTAWRKRTKFCSNLVFRDQKTLCLRDHIHLALRGRSKDHGKSWTLVAQPYPLGVCRAVARAMKLSRGSVCQVGGFDPSKFCRCGGRRIGEASNPGPVRPRSVMLDDVPLVEAKTLALQSKIWKWFLGWLVERVGSDEV